MDIKSILWAKEKVTFNYPYKTDLDKPSYFGGGEIGDILSFGFSYIEHVDHCPAYILVSPLVAKRMIREIDSVTLSVDTEYIGELWTAQIFVTDKVTDRNIVFSNADLSVVLNLNLHRTE